MNREGELKVNELNIVWEPHVHFDQHAEKKCCIDIYGTSDLLKDLEIESSTPVQKSILVIGDYYIEDYKGIIPILNLRCQKVQLMVIRDQSGPLKITSQYGYFVSMSTHDQFTGQCFQLRSGYYIWRGFISKTPEDLAYKPYLFMKSIKDDGGLSKEVEKIIDQFLVDYNINQEIERIRSSIAKTTSC